MFLFLAVNVAMCFSCSMFLEIRTLVAEVDSKDSEESSAFVHICNSTWELTRVVFVHILSYSLGQSVGSSDG